ncbi:MAG: lamin tail domain-containing protein [Pirellulales bacterium]|nr:lamin tail domain-containing protein [Pirellulales bacterium]
MFHSTIHFRTVLAGVTALVIAFSTVDWTVSADIIISEIMYNPDGDDTGKEWVEIFNNSTTRIALDGWTFADIQDMQITNPIPANTFLNPNQALVLVSDATSFDAQWGTGINRIELGNFPLFANTPSPANEILAIRDSYGTVHDSVNYDDENGWPFISPDGSSIFALPSGLTTTGNDLGTSWRPSMPGVYGATYSRSPSGIQDRASPGIVVSQPQASFTPSTDAAWSMVVLPDIQNYVKSSSCVSILDGMNTWIRDNRDTWKIQVVLQEGDIVNNNNTSTPTSGDQTSTQQWENAKNAMSILNGEVPYIMATGNHDYGTTDSQDRTTFFNDYFHASDNPLVDPSQGGILKGVMEDVHLENAYYELEAPDGRQLLIFSLEWGPRQQVISWANRVLSRSTYNDHMAMLLTHAYMYHDETRYDWNRNLDSDPDNNQGGNPHAYPTSGDTHDGQELWEELIRFHENIEMVHSGHVGGDGVGYLEGTGADGTTVYEMLFNTQFETYGGNGWIRVFEFLEDGRTVRVGLIRHSTILSKTIQRTSF